MDEERRGDSVPLDDQAVEAIVPEVQTGRLDQYNVQVAMEVLIQDVLETSEQKLSESAHPIAVAGVRTPDEMTASQSVTVEATARCWTSDSLLAVRRAALVPRHLVPGDQAKGLYVVRPIAVTMVFTLTPGSVMYGGQAFCTNCGASLPPGSGFCTACGAPVGRAPAPPPPARKSGPPRAVLAVVLVAVLAVAGTAIWYFLQDDGGGGGSGGTTAPGAEEYPLALDELGPGPGPQQGITASFDLGPETPVAQDTIGTAGGTIAGTDGLTIAVPDGAHGTDTAYTVTRREILSHDLPAPLQPASALYRVDNGGGLADRAVEVQVPIAIPDGEFAMGYLYDENTGRFEAMPLVGLNGDSVTVATRHFSDFVILWHNGMAVGQLPAPAIDTGFRPGVDDWQFPNLGTAAEFGGHCSGQSLSAMWYFTEQRKAAGQPPLYGLFDNTDGDPLNRVWPLTGSLWQDDRDGYRLATVVQARQYGQSATNYESAVDRLTVALHFEGFDSVIYSAFGSAMWVTGEPQYAGILEYVDADADRRWDAGEMQGGHAMIVYGATNSGLYVADPNHPASFRMISWNPTAKVDPSVATPGVLGPFNSALKAGATGTAFNVIGLYGKSALVDWRDLAGAWPEFLAGTIGDDILPGYGLQARYVDANGSTQTRSFRDRLVVAVEEIELTIDGGTEDWRLEVYDGDTLLGAAEKGVTETVPVSLDDGANDFGVYVSVKRPDGSSQGWFWAFVDFDRITITRGTGLTLDMLPDESEVAGLNMLVKDPPAFRENPDVPGEIIGITAGYKAGPVEVFRSQQGASPYVEGWVVFEPDPADVCLGTGFGGAAGGFGRNLCIGVSLSLWGDDPTPFDVAAVQAEDLPTGALPPTMPAYVPCLVYQPPAYIPAFNTATQFPCVEDFTGNVDDGVEIYGWISEDRNLGLQHYRVRAVVEGVRIDVGTSYRNTQTSDVSSARMREVVSALVNEIARKIRVELGA